MDIFFSINIHTACFAELGRALSLHSVESRSNQDWSDWVSFCRRLPGPSHAFSRCLPLSSPICWLLFPTQPNHWPACSQLRQHLCLKLWKRRNHTTWLHEAVLQPQADAIIFHCIFLRSTSRAAGHAQPVCRDQTHWPKTSEAAL